MFVESGQELWARLTHVGGLDVERYDSVIVSGMRDELGLPPDGSLDSHLERIGVSTEGLLTAFFRVVAPYTIIFADILRFLEAVGTKRGRQNVEVQFDFGAARKLGLDLEEFRRHVEQCSAAIRPLEIEHWSPKDLWKLPRLFRNLVPMRLAGVDPSVLKWCKDCRNGQWPTINPSLPPRVSNPEHDQVVSHLWSIWNAIVSGSIDAGVSPSNTRDFSFEDVPVPVAGNRVLSASRYAGTLASLHDNGWARWLIRGLFDFVQNVMPDGSLDSHVIEGLKQIFGNVPSERRDVAVTVRDLYDFLSLPLWKFRHELYSIWVFTRIVDAAGGPDRFEFQFDGDVFHIPFKGKCLAISQDLAPPLYLWSEVRSPLNELLREPRGASRKRGMQPDYTLALDNGEPPDSAILLIEAKQFLNAHSKRFAGTLADYAEGKRDAMVLLVNYGPASNLILDRVPSDLRARASIIGDHRPSENKSIKRFNDLVRTIIEEHCKSTAVMDSSHQGVETAPTPCDIVIELDWLTKPGRLHRKSLPCQHFFKIGFIPTCGEAFVFDTDLES